MDAVPQTAIASEPEAGATLRTKHGRAWVVDRADLLDSAVWKELFQRHCKDHRYYEIVEQTLPGKFDYHYLVLENERTGAMAIQPFFFTDQDLIAGLPRHLRTIVKPIRSRFPRFMKMKMLMVGCAAGEGQLGALDEWAVDALHEALALHGRQTKASLILLKDFCSSYRSELAVFSNDGYARIPSMPATILDLRFESFDDYMDKALSRVSRKSLRRKFKRAAQSPPATMEVLHDITPIVDEVYPLYQQVLARSEFRFEELTKDYLCQLGQRMPDKARFFLWRQAGRVVAFSVCMIHGDTLYDNYLGLDYSVALDKHLYFVTFRDIMQWAIEQKLRYYYSTPLNYDPKLHLRFDLKPLDLYVCHPSPLINLIFRRVVPLLEPTRYDAALRKFRNNSVLWS